MKGIDYLVGQHGGELVLGLDGPAGDMGGEDNVEFWILDFE